MVETSARRLYEDPEWCRRRYFDELKTFVEMAAEAGCCPKTVTNWFRAHGYVPAPGGERVRLRGSLRGDKNPSWTGDDVKRYESVHRRIKRLFGPASTHACRNCGEPAAEWAYDHADPDERRDPQRNYVGPYSLKPEHYQPKCGSCHHREDQRRSPTSFANRTHCPLGHIYDEANTHIQRGGRVCRKCRQIRKKKYRAQARARRDQL